MKNCESYHKPSPITDWELRHKKRIPIQNGFEYYGLFSMEYDDGTSKYLCALTNGETPDENSIYKPDEIDDEAYYTCKERFNSYYNEDIKIIYVTSAYTGTELVWNNSSIDRKDLEKNIVIYQDLHTKLYYIFTGNCAKYSPDEDFNEVIFPEELTNSKAYESEDDAYDGAYFIRQNLWKEMKAEFVKKYGNLIEQTERTNFTKFIYNKNNPQKRINCGADYCCKFSIDELKNLIATMESHNATDIIIKQRSVLDDEVGFWEGISLIGLDETGEYYTHYEIKPNMKIDLLGEYAAPIYKERE